jgi:Ohr subfamily peroxiredoxin
MIPVYSTTVDVSGGREGAARSSDGILDLPLALPAELGGPGGKTNPEQLFAAGYGACFESAVRLIAREAGLDVGELSIAATVQLLKAEDSMEFALSVELAGTSSTLTQSELAGVLAQAHAICPYSNATRGNIDVRLSPAA